MSEQNGGTSENRNSLRLDEMQKVVQSLIDLGLQQSRLSTIRHEEFMAEMQELKELQKEQRIGIMPLFAGNSELRQLMKQYLEKHNS